jgi:hypothetical protein
MKRIAFWLFVSTAKRGRSPFNEELLPANNEANERFDFSVAAPSAIQHQT